MPVVNIGMRRSVYDNSHNRTKMRVDARQNNWATRLGVRSQHKDMRGNVIGGIAADGTRLGTKQEQRKLQIGMRPASAPVQPQAAQPAARPSAPAPAPAKPRPSAIAPSTPKADPLRARMFPDRSKPTPEGKLTPQIATSTPGARTSNINRLTGKPMGWRPGDDATPAPSTKPAMTKTSPIEPAGPPASAKHAPGWVKATMPQIQGPPASAAPKAPAMASTPVAPSPTKAAPPADRMPTPAKQSPLTIGGTPVRTENYGSGGPSPASAPAKPAPQIAAAAPQTAPAQPDKIKRANFTASMRWQDRASNKPSTPPSPPATPSDITATAMNMDRMKRQDPLRSATMRSAMKWQQ